MDVKFDQHYLNDENILKKIVEVSNISNDDVVLEIGSGKGSLTDFIVQRFPKKLICVEIDNSFEYILKEYSEKYDFFEFFIGDIITEIDNLKFNKIVANIPYGITENLYRKIIEKEVPKVVLTHGKNFYDLLECEVSMWHHIVSAFYNIKLVDVITGDSFEPATKVKSVIVDLVLKNSNFLSSKDIFIRNMFSKKSRSLKNCIVFSLVDTFNVSKKDAEKIFYDMNLDDSILSKGFNNISNESFMKIIKGMGFD